MKKRSVNKRTLGKTVPGMARDHAVVLRMDVVEREMIEACAQELGLTMSSWMRMTLLERARKQFTKYG